MSRDLLKDIKDIIDFDKLKEQIPYINERDIINNFNDDIIQDYTNKTINDVKTELINLIVDDFKGKGEFCKLGKYNLLECNCYAHTWYCIGGAKEKITDFDDFNEKLFTLTQQAIYWDKVELSCVY